MDKYVKKCRITIIVERDAYMTFNVILAVVGVISGSMVMMYNKRNKKNR